ncbi:MAG TPA: Hint domain-containing protein [Pirellulaceae bacterium]|nr:Hint domain-containing protein [Pirellulaceae bacterium]
MSAKPRRWFSFSLRTMFVVVTLLCCYLAWETSIVRQRQAMRRELSGKPYVQVTTAEAWLQLLSPGRETPKMATISRVRRWLGDEPIQQISYARGYHHLTEEQIDRLKRVFPEANVSEYEALLEPCHPGCFPRGTLIETPQGRRPIENVRVGDALTAFLPDGQGIVANVQSVFVTRNRLWKVETEDGVLLTTEAQPLCRSTDRPIRAGDLLPGHFILRYINGELRAVEVRNVSPTDRLEKVFNLVLGDSELFVAGGFLARSKPPAE